VDPTLSLTDAVPGGGGREPARRPDRGIQATHRDALTTKLARTPA
jgi:hypothetical protein